MWKLTREVLERALPLSRNIDRYCGALAASMEACAINTPERACAFLAQVGHESAQLNRVEENLNYSAEGLARTFPRIFRDVQAAAPYARHPERIANRVYAGRLGNGDEASGDGWKFRGRGLIQITGRDNYASMSALMGKDLTVWPDALLMPMDACLSAARWWRAHGLNEMADGLSGSGEDEVFRAITRKVNGGLNGIDDRLDIYRRAKEWII